MEGAAIIFFVRFHPLKCLEIMVASPEFKVGWQLHAIFIFFFSALLMHLESILALLKQPTVKEHFFLLNFPTHHGPTLLKNTIKFK